MSNISPFSFGEVDKMIYRHQHVTGNQGAYLKWLGVRAAMRNPSAADAMPLSEIQAMTKHSNPIIAGRWKRVLAAVELAIEDEEKLPDVDPTGENGFAPEATPEKLPELELKPVTEEETEWLDKIHDAATEEQLNAVFKEFVASNFQAKSTLDFAGMFATRRDEIENEKFQPGPTPSLDFLTVKLRLAETIRELNVYTYKIWEQGKWKQYEDEIGAARMRLRDAGAKDTYIHFPELAAVEIDFRPILAAADAYKGVVGGLKYDEQGRSLGYHDITAEEEDKLRDGFLAEVQNAIDVGLKFPIKGDLNACGKAQRTVLRAAMFDRRSDGRSLVGSAIGKLKALIMYGFNPSSS